MRVLASHLLVFVAVALVAVGLGAALLRAAKPAALRAFGWLVLFGGLGALALLALLLLTGRFGPEYLWFRTPAFYIAAVTLLAAGVWWLRRPAAPMLRFGLPALLIVGLAVGALAARLDGRSAPIAMLLPTLDARAPELSYFDTTGRRRTLADLHGRVVLLNFWATWCAPCR